MGEKTIECPSGLTVTVRGVNAKEFNLLADRKGLRTGESYDKILKQCTVSAGELAVYHELGKLDWLKALVCDRFYALLRIREETYPGLYEFPVPCSSPFCERLIPWELQLSDLPVKKLPDDSAEKIAAGENRFPLTLHDGRAAEFKLQTGDGEKYSSRLVQKAKGQMVVAAIASRIISVEGVKKGGLMAYLSEMPGALLLDILDEFDEVDGGVETIIDVECDECGRVQEVELPLGADFWLPKTKRSKARKRRRQRSELDDL